jgi:predicted MPP superfamily phosphohydrolase
MVNGPKPDIIILTGDYVDNSQYPLTSYFISNPLTYIDPCIGAIGRLTANFGVFTVLGNHDNLRYLEIIRRSFLNHNITLIENTRQLIEKEDETICISGVEDLWGWSSKFTICTKGYI